MYVRQADPIVAEQSTSPFTLSTILSAGFRPDCTSSLCDRSIACTARHGTSGFRLRSVV
jgi:hypothetical protein